MSRRRPRRGSCSRPPGTQEGILTAASEELAGCCAVAVVIITTGATTVTSPRPLLLSGRRLVTCRGTVSKHWVHTGPGKDRFRRSGSIRYARLISRPQAFGSGLGSPPKDRCFLEFTAGEMNSRLG